MTDTVGQADLTAWAEKTGIDRTTMVRNAKVLSAKGVTRLAAASVSFAMAFGIIMGAVTPILGEKKAAALLCYTVKEEK